MKNADKSAFARPNGQYRDGGMVVYNDSQVGLTKREYYAGQALGYLVTIYPIGQAAMLAVEAAASLIAELDKPENAVEK